MTRPDSVSIAEGEQQVVWRRVDDLSAAGPDDAVFVLSPETGTFVFGDGEHGRRPPDGASVTINFFVGGLIAAGDLVLEQEFLRPRPLRAAAGAIRQIMPAGGWSAVLSGEVVPLVGWALLDSVGPVFQDGGEPRRPPEHSVRGLVVGPASVVHVVDEQPPSFGGYRPG